MDNNNTNTTSFLGRFILQIPNLFTVANLFFGCLAIVTTLQNGLIVSNENQVQQVVDIPEKIVIASLFIAIAAIIDFLDGFVARLLKASSSMGKELDSLADVVSFGVAPAMIIYQFLRLSFAQEPNGLEINNGWLYLAFIVPCAGAYRLARFNIDTHITSGFKGVPIPAAGLLIASLPLIYWYNTNIDWLMNLLRNKWFWYTIIFIISYLMISTLPILSLKFKGISFKQLLPFIIVLISGCVAAFFCGWFAITIGFVVYVLVSVFSKPAIIKSTE
jgi:CDP-diacylglycerol---serine O-phosphatidyltransferase